MTIPERIRADLKEAMRAHDRPRTEALRLLLNECKNAGIEKRGASGAGASQEDPITFLNEEELLAVLRRVHKRRLEAAAQFEEGGREDLAAGERAEAALVEHYLPAALSAQELEALAHAVIEDLGATSMKDMGRVMKEASARAAGRAAGKELSAVVRKLLA